MATADGGALPPRPAEAPLEPAVTDIGILVAPPPRGLGLDLEDRGLSETLKRNPEALTKEAVNHLVKRRFVTAIAGKVFAVRASSLPNVVRAIARVLYLSNAHSRKLWEEFRGCGALEELMTRMGVVVGEGRYNLAGDLLQAFLPLLYVGEGLEDAGGDECGVEFLAGLSLAGKGRAPHPQQPYPQQPQQQQPEAAAPQPDAASLVRNKYVYNALVMAFYKIAPYHAQEGAEADAGFVKYCSDFLDVVMRVLASGGENLRALMAGHPLQPILQQLGELPPEVTYKLCTWVSFLCTYNRCAPITELSTMVNAARLLFERGAHSRDPQESFKVFNVVRSLRYLVTSTIQADARFKLVWNEAGLVDALLGVIGTSKGERAGVAPFTTSLAVDTLLWLARGCARNARLVVASGGARTLEALLAKDTHFPEGVSLWAALMRELALEMTTGPAAASAAGQVEDEQHGASREFADLLGVALADLERRFARAVAAHPLGKDGALSGAFHNGGVVALAYVRGLTVTAEVPYARGSWAPRAGQQPPPLAEGKEFHQCILLLHALTSLLVPPDGPDVFAQAQAPVGAQGAAMGQAGGGSGHQAGGGVPALLETAYDGVPFLVPMVLASIRRHRGQALRWLTLKPPVAPAVGVAFARALRVRRAFVRAGALERILGVLEQCVAQMEAGAWAPERLCTGGPDAGPRIAFGPFVGGGDNDSYASGGNSQVGLANDDNTALAEFLGSTLLAFAAAMSRLHPPNSIEGAAAVAHAGGASLAGGMASRASERHSLALFRQLAGLLLRLLRPTLPRLKPRAGDAAGGARAAQAVLFFVARFLLSTALGGYSPLVETVLNPRAVGLPAGGGASSPPPMPMALPIAMPMMGAAPADSLGGASGALLGQQELHSPRALLLALELLAEYPVGCPGFDFLLPVLQALADFARRLCKAQERNLELALDAGLVRSALWACLRPAASHPGVEAALTGLLAFAAGRRTAPEDLRLWFNAVLFDYGLAAQAEAAGEGGGRVEARRLSLLRALVDVANGLPSPPQQPSPAAPALDGPGAADSFLARRDGHIFGSAPLVLFDPAGGDERQGPRLAIPSLHPEGFEEAASAGGGGGVVGSLVGGVGGGQEEGGRVRAWPPARGYTVSVWFCIEAYDRFTRRLPLLTLTEDGEVLTALEVSDGMLTLATGPGKDAQAACDRLPRLQEGEWYHLTVAHHRARNRAMQAVVYLNGSPVQTLRLAYPRATQGLHRVQLVMGQVRASPTAGPGAAPVTVTRVKWALGPTYILAEPLSDASALLLYAVGPTAAHSFVGEDGQGSFPFCYDLCTALQLKQLIQALRAAGRERGNPNHAAAGAGHHHHHVPPTPVGGPGAGAVSGRGSGGGAAARGQFTDLTAAPVDATGITAEQVVLSLAPREASDDPTSLEALCAYSACCTQEAMSVELSGGALAVARARAADALRYACQFPLAPIMMLCERAATVGELELALRFLLAVTRAHPGNLQAMEKGHFYAILAQLLRRKARQGLVVVRTVEPLLAMVGRVRLVAEDGAVEHQLMPVNLQALQHLVFNFGIWRHADPAVHRLVLETLGAAVAISGSGGNEAQLAAQELNLRRFQFAGVTRAVLYMLIEPGISYDLLLSMCDLVYLVLTRATPPLEDLAAVAQLLAATASLRFQKLYVEGLIGSDTQQQQHGAGASGAAATAGTPKHHGGHGHGHGHASHGHRHGSGSGTPRRRSQHGGHDQATAQARVLRLKVLRRGLLRLLIKVAEHYVLKAQQASKAASRPPEPGAPGQRGGPSSPVPGGGAAGGGGGSSATAAADNEPLALFLRAIPPKLLLHLAHHFGDVAFWWGAAAGKPDLAPEQLPFAEAAGSGAGSGSGSGVASPMGERAMSPTLGLAAASAGAGAGAGAGSPPRAAARRRISASASTVLGGKRAARRHQDPISALLAYQLLVAVMPYAQKPVDRLGGLAFLQHILPAVFKSIDVQSDADAALLSSAPCAANPSSPTPSGEAGAGGGGGGSGSGNTWGRHYIWQPKALAYETQEVRAFFGQPLADDAAVASGGICSPSFHHCLRTLYRTQFAHLLGGSSLFLTLEQVFDAGLTTTTGAAASGLRAGGRASPQPSGAGAGAGKSLVPTQMIHMPGVLVPILATVCAAAGMATPEGLIQTVAARPLARGDSELHQLLQHTPGAKALAAARAWAAALVARKSLAFLHSLYVESQELREIFRGEVPASMQSGGVAGGVASRFGRLPKPEELVEELAQVYYAGLMAQLAQRFASSGAEPAEAEVEAGAAALAEESPVCQLALRFLLSAAFDRLLHSSKAVASIQALLDVWPRDLHLFHPLSAPGAGGEQPPASPSEEGGAVPSPSSSAFAKALQAHFRSAVLHALMGEVRARLTEHGSGSGAPSPYLSTAAYKLTHNLPRFFGLVAANTFLARSWPESPFLPPLSGAAAVPQRDFWLLTSMQFLIDMLGLMVVPPPSTEQGQLGVVFRSAKQQQAALAAAFGGAVAGAKPASSAFSAASFLGGQAKQAMGDLFGISKWMGDDVDEWVTAAVDGLRKALLTGLTWLEDGLLDATVSKLFETAIRHLGLLLPQLHAPRAAEADRQFVAALLHLLYPLLSDEKPQYREASTYVWRELLASPAQRRILEALLSVPQAVTVRGKKGEPVEKVVTLNLLTCSNGTGAPVAFAGAGDGPEGFDMILRINVQGFAFIQALQPKLSPPRAAPKGIGSGLPHDFADKEFQSWLGSLPPDIQDKIPKALAQGGRAFRDWPELGAAQALSAYRQSVVATEKRRRKASHEALKALTKATAAWRKELKGKQDVELRRQVRWPQERLDRETFGARRMEVVFAELVEGTSLAVAPGGVLLKGLGHGDGYLSSHRGEDAGAAEALVQGLTLPVDDGGLLGGMQRGVGGGDLCLDSAEGPMRIRKKLVRATFKLGRGPAAGPGPAPGPLSLPPSISSTGTGSGAAAPPSPTVARAPSMGVASPQTPTRQGSGASSLAKQASLQASIPVAVSPQAVATQQQPPPPVPPRSPSVHFAPEGPTDCGAARPIPPEEEGTTTAAAAATVESDALFSSGTVATTAAAASAGSPRRSGSKTEAAPAAAAAAALGASADRDFFSSQEDEDEDEDEELLEEEELLTEDEEDLLLDEAPEEEEGAAAADGGEAAGAGSLSPGAAGMGVDGAAAPALGTDEAAAESAAENPNRRSLAVKTKQLKEQQRLVLHAGASNAEVQAGAAEEGGADGQDPVGAAGGVEGPEAGAEEEDDEAEGLVGADDKLKPFLVPGDEIRHRYNCARVQGVYAYPGIVLFCDHHLYIIDNYKLAASEPSTATAAAAGTGAAASYEVVEIQPEEAAILQTPSSMQARGGGAGGDVTAWGAAASTALQNNPVPISEQLRAKCAPGGSAGPSHRCHYFPFEEITVVYRRRYHLRHVALEVFLSNGENHLVTVDDPGTRNELLQKLKERCSEATTLDVKASPLDEIQTFLNLANPSSLTERWVRGEISNFQYLMHLNTLSGRSYNDLTQYPVFPWIIADWESEELDLANPATFRDLTKPMGALSPAREMEFRERYALLKESEQPNDPKKAFHYGTHFSSAAIVLYYLVRLQPFSEQHVRLQSGRFDHSDRLFSTMRKSWQASSGGLSGDAADGADGGGGGGGSSTNTQDVRELIPEFFYLPDFLTNPNGYDFGAELDGHRIDDVGLPPWARGSAHEFIRLHRQALESEYVSRHLHHWIDLIWGYKQRGKAAEEACNVFYYLTYEGAIDLEAVEDPNLRKAYVEQIHEFGQTPSQLFRQPHPARQIPNPATAAEREHAAAAAGAGGGGGGGVVGGIGAAAPQWLRNLKDLKVPGAGRNTPSPQPPAAPMTAAGPPAESAGVLDDEDGDLPPALPMQAMLHRPSVSAAAAAATGRAALASSGPLPPKAAPAGCGSGVQPRSWAMAELRRVLTSEAALRLLPPRRTAACLPAKVAQWAAAAARASGRGDPDEPVNQVAVGQIVLGSAPERPPLALHAGCAGVGPASGDAFLAWGFADDCLRLGVATPGAEAHAPGAAALALPERKLTVALDAAGPIGVLAVSGDGRTLITGSSARPVIHVWSVQKGLGRRAPTGKRQPPVVLLGTLISALHAGSITNVALSATYGIVVSVCSHNRVALLWDLNRRRLVRQLALATTGRAATDSGNDLVNLAIDETTGTIVVTAGATLHVYDANGSPLATLDASALPLRESLGAARGGTDGSSTGASASGASAGLLGAGAVNVLKAPATPISACCVVGDGCAPTTIVTGHLDGHIRVWALEYGKRQEQALPPAAALAAGLLGGERKQLALSSGGGMVLMASPVVTAAVPDEDDEESDEEEDEEEQAQEAAQAPAVEEKPAAGNTSNCLTLLNELSYYPAASPSLPSRAPITALTMAPDARRFFSGDAAGVVCAWTAMSSGPAVGHTPGGSNPGPGAGAGGAR